MPAISSERAPSREDFAALLEESFKGSDTHEGSVIRGLFS